MKPIPVDFHIGPLLVHTYGIGLAITFLFGYKYFERRLRDHGYPYEWLGSAFLWIIAAAIIGARVVHVVANAGFYIRQPIQIPLIWHGGLSSFGGLALGLVTGFALARRHCPQLSGARAADLLAPVLLASWALGRLLGPQLMIRGGGHPTNQWFGMYYAGQVGKRLPVPIFQSMMTVGILLIAWQVEKLVERRGGPTGLVMAVSAGFWGTGRFFEEHLWLAYPGHIGAIATQVGGVIVAVCGFAVAARLLIRDHHRLATASGTALAASDAALSDAPLAHDDSRGAPGDTPANGTFVADSAGADTPASTAGTNTAGTSTSGTSTAGTSAGTSGRAGTKVDVADPMRQ